MDRRAPQIVSGTATSTVNDDSTSSYGPSPGYSVTACPTGNSICYDTPTSTADSSATDFSSTALWAVVVATLGAATFMAGLLFYLRRLKRIRARCAHKQYMTLIPIHHRSGNEFVQSFGRSSTEYRMERLSRSFYRTWSMVQMALALTYKHPSYLKPGYR
jgi:hypothetical protein